MPYAIIRLNRKFESLMLNSLVGAINNDTNRTISAQVGIAFPTHLTDEVCEFLIIGGGYFDFKGRDGLIRILREYLPDSHYLVSIVGKPAYRATLNKLSAVRNFAAHDSYQSKRAALKAIGGLNLESSGSWLKRQGRFGEIVKSLKELAGDVEAQAPY